MVDDIPAILFALDPDQYEKYFPRLSKEDIESMYQKYKEMKGTYPDRKLVVDIVLEMAKERARKS